MTHQEFEKIIQKSLRIKNTPSHASLERVLATLSPVTKTSEVRYTRQTATSNITNNIFNKISNIWKSNSISILVPAFILLFFVGAFSLSPLISTTAQNRAIVRLAEQDASIEELGNDTDGQVVLASFDEPDSADLDTSTNEF